MKSSARKIKNQPENKNFSRRNKKLARKYFSERKDVDSAGKIKN